MNLARLRLKTATLGLRTTAAGRNAAIRPSVRLSRAASSQKRILGLRLMGNTRVLGVKPTGQRGRMATGSGRNGPKHIVSIHRADILFYLIISTRHHVLDENF